MDNSPFGAAISDDLLFISGSRPTASGSASLEQLPLRGDIAAIRAGAGSTIWSTPAGRGVLSDPTPGPSRVFVASFEGDLAALSRHSGQPLWSTSDGLVGPPQAPLLDASVGRVIVAGRSSKTSASGTFSVHAYDTRTGRQVWSIDRPRCAFVAIDAALHRVYIDDCAGSGLSAILDTTGKQTTSTPKLGSPIGLECLDGLLYEVEASSVRCVDPISLRSLWTTRLAVLGSAGGAKASAAPPLGGVPLRLAGNTLVLFTYGKPALVALDRRTGYVLWSLRLPPNADRKMLAVGTNGVAYVTRGQKAAPAPAELHFVSLKGRDQGFRRLPRLLFGGSNHLVASSAAAFVVAATDVVAYRFPSAARR